MRKIVYILVVCAAVSLLNGLTANVAARQKAKHHILVLYTGKKPMPVSVWLDERLIIEDTVIDLKKKPPLVNAVGVANLHQYKKVTAKIGKSSYYSLIQPTTVDIVIVAHDTLKPIQLSKRSLPLK